MNNEPVAWMQTLINGHTGEVKHTLEFIRVGINDIPLYTYPAKTLTDEEIQQAIDGIDWNQSNVLIRFARAILKKASEK